ncbi:hypothetical protein ROLI_005050 [Roseobacter fucihabitans]|uniref:SH3b domain-containing protein n=1 Tax=Roseobacter fucihabitans TaxID=1537242 RepID=A0ABZ2BPH7_9RHOB|nr:SH3 domain-containing protein [Roseobacter litoralis]MBC6964679.1 Bacterial SH3 domain protein [Roseobacter litoralis]
MNRFILVSFAFLALGFYEISGGADFDPIAARDAAVIARADPDVPLASSHDKMQAIAAASSDDAPTVTRLSLSLTSFDDALSAQEPAPPPTILAKPEPLAPLTSPSIVGATTVTFDATPDEDEVLPSIIFSGSRAQASSQSVSAPRDIRFVSAAVVNMRGGPGTGFDVVSKLQRNTEVEILQDDGTGWVKLRAVSGGPEGWIADYLLSNG